MLPPRAAQELRRLGHNAVSVLDLGMAALEDSEIFARAVQENRMIVTENFGDFANLLQQRQSQDEGCVPVLFVRRATLPKRGPLPTHLALRLHEWAAANPEPFVGLHWP